MSAGLAAGAAAAGLGASQPSQFGAAVAGVQVASRQQSVPSPFLHGVPVELTQLSTFFGWAIAEPAEIVITAASISFRVLFIFYPQKTFNKLMQPNRLKAQKSLKRYNINRY
ncbi:MAG: hypothetical protein EBV46_01095 [Burkholderiaceae bacterium]|nr:hypothetical protein [Burkholderiaceae bacterium]